MEKTHQENQTQKLKEAKHLLWDCGSTLYDSFELKSFERQLDSAINSRSFSMPHVADRSLVVGVAPPVPAALPPPVSKKPSKISRSLHKFLKSVFKSKQNSSRVLRIQEGHRVVYDKSAGLSTIPEVPEIGFGGFSPEIKSSLKRGTASASVTGSSGYLGSWLVKKLLAKGCIVHATLKSLENTRELALLKSLPNAETNLIVYQANLFKPMEYEQPIKGCDYVFHLAHPMQHEHENANLEEIVEATVASVKTVAEICSRSKTVKRFIYTSSLSAASPRNEDGIGYKPCLDESCWTPIHLSSFPYGDKFTLPFIKEKTWAEKEVLKYNTEAQNAGMEVVTLACGLVGGETMLDYVPGTVEVILSQLTRRRGPYDELRLLQNLFGLLPLVHIEDAIDAHIFCMEQPSIKGRFILVATTTTFRELAAYHEENHPEFNIEEKLVGEPQQKVVCDSMKLRNMGFEYKYDMKKIVEESFDWAKRLGYFSHL